MANKFEINDFLPYLLVNAAEHISALFEQEYGDKYDLNRAQWRIIANLGAHGKLTATDISKLGNLDKSKTSRNVQTLTERKLLQKIPNLDDRRADVLSLTPQGEALFKDVSKIAIAFDKKLSQSVGNDFAPLLKLLLEKLASENA